MLTLLLATLPLGKKLYAEDKPPPLLPQMFFDAERSFLDREGQNHIFEGDVVAIAAKIMVTADHLALDRKNNTFKAVGHVIVISGDQVLMGESLVFDTLNQGFTLTQAMLIANDPGLVAQIHKHVLGFSVEELAFESARAQRLQEIAAKKEELRQLFRGDMQTRDLQGRDVLARSKKNSELIEQYIILLEKEEAIRRQENAVLGQMGGEKKEAFKRRREYWNQGRAESLQLGSKISQIGYFTLEGEVLKRQAEDRFSASRAFISPCLCEQGAKPAWGFRAETIEAQGEAYADLYHPILEIKGVPLLYLPFLKIPIKSKRQSGFLLPSLSHNNLNGTMYSQPIYFDFDEKSDATLTTDWIEKRGFRLGVEYRIQQKQFSGWEFHLDSIRDKLWLQEKEQRERVAERYRLGLDKAVVFTESNPDFANGLPSDHPLRGTEADPGWWRSQPGLDRCLSRDMKGNCIRHEIDNHLLLPANTWRGQFDWKGQLQIAPRLGFVSQGMLLSDHRYQQDLWIPSINDFLTERPTQLFATSKARLHLDGKDFYAGFGSSFADPFLASERFSGYQVPMGFKVQSRMFSLFSQRAPLPFYGQLSLDQRRIEVFNETKFNTTLPSDVMLQRLGNGNWRRLFFKTNSPLLKDQIISADYFGEFEYRGIEPDRIHQASHYLSPAAEEQRGSVATSRSLIHTARTGLHFSLPLDGRWEYAKDTGGTTTIEHRMNWDMTLSLRPYAARRGNYGNTHQTLAFNPSAERWEEVVGTRPLTYYPSDHSLQPHQQLIFATTHDWFSAEKAWTLVPGNVKPDEAEAKEGSAAANLRARAEQELLYSLDRPITGHEQMFDERGSWFINRYRLVDESTQSPLHIDANISYDYVQAKLRQKQERERRDTASPRPLAEPWSPLVSHGRLTWQRWMLDTTSTYNLYNKNVTSLNFTFGPPPVWASQLTLGYLIEKAVSLTTTGGYTASLTKTQTANIHTDLIPYVGADVAVGRQLAADSTMRRKTALGLSYMSPSRCWGLRFAWGKNFEDLTWDGHYYLGLVVNFLTNQREFGNFTSRFNPEV